MPDKDYLPQLLENIQKQISKIDEKLDKMIVEASQEVKEMRDEMSELKIRVEKLELQINTAKDTVKGFLGSKWFAAIVSALLTLLAANVPGISYLIKDIKF